MLDIFKTLFVIALAIGGIVGGYHISRLKWPWWTIGFFVPFVIVIMMGLARRIDALTFVAPFSWMMYGRNEFVLMGPAIGMMLTTPTMHLDRKSKKVLVLVLMGIVLAYFPVAPFAIPLFMRGYHSRMKTRINDDGVCLQSNVFNCGPASAVTALKLLGVEAGEGELAILAYTTPVGGTPPDLLCNAINGKYGNVGITCAYRYFDSIKELSETDGVPIVVLKYSLLVDHYVTVLDIDDKSIIVGDPLRGKHEYSHDSFMSLWRRSGIVVNRKQKSPE
ncbi:MAG: cysteine peptidase family C39 domain-containing protein [Planctomycetota bacterium]|jgi:hypothetical protein